MKTLIDIYVQPGAKTTEIVGRHDGRIKIRVASPPEDGRANEEVLLFIAKKLGVKKSEVELKQGHKSRLKTISVPKEALKNNPLD